MSLMEKPEFIVVEGPIGVGKTTLAKKLAHSFGSELLLEGAAENPFMSRFYENPKSRCIINAAVLFTAKSKADAGNTSGRYV